MDRKKVFMISSILVMFGVVSFLLLNARPGLVQRVLPFTQEKGTALLDLHMAVGHMLQSYELFPQHLETIQISETSGDKNFTHPTLNKRGV